MLAFENTWLWQSAFEDNPDREVTGAERAFFREHFLEMRDRVKPLVARAAADMPGYTAHDMTHLDALWETASLVSKPSLALNPPEGFVFGGAILLHDASMAPAAYPRGLDELKQTTKRADIAAKYAGGGPSKPSSPDLELRIKVEVLRQLHAEKAQELPTQGWRTSPENDEKIHLIDHVELRRFYGNAIGALPSAAPPAQPTAAARGQPACGFDGDRCRDPHNPTGPSTATSSILNRSRCHPSNRSDLSPLNPVAHKRGARRGR
jgi:hypothetical protein